MKKKGTIMIAWFLYQFCFIGCTDELRKAAPAVDPRVHQLATDQVAVTVKGMEQPDSYQVQLEWPNATGTVRISERSVILGVVAGSDKRFIQSEVKGGSKLSYLVEQISEVGNISASIPVFVEVPTDFLWSEGIDLTEHTKIEASRVFLTNKAVITTYDKNLTIIADEIISDGGTIQSFPEGSRAKFETNGLTGGTITINAKKGVGTLQLNLRGQDGGPGKNGIAPGGAHPGCAGGNGANGGSAGSINATFADGNGLNISFLNKEGAKGLAGKRGSVGWGTPADEAVYPPCFSEAPEGVDGVAGGKGQVCLKMSAEQEYVCQ